MRVVALPRLTPQVGAEEVKIVGPGVDATRHGDRAVPHASLRPGVVALVHELPMREGRVRRSR